MKFACHLPGPLLPMVNRFAGQGSCKGVIEQSLMSMTMGVPINSSQRARFSFIELKLPVDSRQQLTQQPVG